VRRPLPIVSLLMVSALRARLFGNIALVLSYRLKHNSAVPDDAEPLDSFSSVALEYAF
jgi:putative salt-induced outer membrane protein YdiY